MYFLKKQWKCSAVAGKIDKQLIMDKTASRLIG